MSDLAVFVLVAWLMAAVATSVGCVAVVRALGRANRVVPDRPSPAPISWLWSWRSGPRLHRRLQRALHVATTVVASYRPSRRRGDGRRRRPMAAPLLPSQMAEVADALVARAAALDGRLVVAARAPAHWRIALYADLRAEIAELEAAVIRLGRLITTWQAHLRTASAAGALPPLSVHDRLAAMEAALADLAPLQGPTPGH